MELVHDRAALRHYMAEAVKVSGSNPVLVDKYLDGAIEVDVDAISDGQEVHIAGIMEQIEEAGVHSGDSACVLPPHTLAAPLLAELRRQTKILARALGVVGLMNVQYAVQNDQVFVIEVNPRASRTVPFVAKATGVPVAKTAARVMAGEALADFGLTDTQLDHVAVKEAVLPFARFPDSEPVLGPEMKSTGESMGIDRDFATAYLKAQLGAGVRPPRSGNALLSLEGADQLAEAALARRLHDLGFELWATWPTAAGLHRAGLPVRSEAQIVGGATSFREMIDRGEIQLLVDTTATQSGHTLRAQAVQRRVAYCSRLSIAEATVKAIARLRTWKPAVQPLQSYNCKCQPLKLFVRQPLTQSGDESKAVVQAVMRVVAEIGAGDLAFDYLTGEAPQSERTFRESFEAGQGQPFTARNFRRYRLEQLQKAEAFLYIRTAMSESGAFEVAYNVFKAPRAPMFFAIWKRAPIKTTLLRELEEVSDVTYCEFDEPEELRADLQRFFHRVADGRRADTKTPSPYGPTQAIAAHSRAKEAA